MPDSQSTEELKLIVVNLRQDIKLLVQFACRKHNHGVRSDEVEELTEQIILFLLEAECRRLKTYNPSKGTLKTWLRQVIFHEVSRHYQKQNLIVAIDDLSEIQIGIAALQDEEMLRKEYRSLLCEAIKQLTLHDQQITYLKLRDISDQEIALTMNVKVRSLQQEWSRILKRLKIIMKRGANAVPH